MNRVCKITKNSAHSLHTPLKKLWSAYYIHKADGIYILGYPLGHKLGVAHGMHHGGRLVCHVATGEHPFAGGHSVGGVAGKHISLVINVDTLGSGYDTRGRGASHGQHEPVGLQRELLAVASSYSARRAFISFMVR